LFAVLSTARKNGKLNRIFRRSFDSAYRKPIKIVWFTVFLCPFKTFPALLIGKEEKK